MRDNWLGAVLFVSFGVVCLLVGIVFGRDFMRQDAIKNGVAKWTVNETTGETKFEWVTKGESK